MLGAMTMVSGNTLAEVAGLIGDPARANMLLALMDGRALTAGELAWAAGVTRADGERATRQAGRGAAGRGRAAGPPPLPPARLARGGARDRGTLMAIAAAARGATAGRAARRRAAGRPHLLRPPRRPPRRGARRQPAGPRPVAVADEGDGAAAVTRRGGAFLSARLGVDLARRRPARVFAATCLDWSERRPHLAGRLGAALCRRALELGWIERARDGRAVAVTPAGRRGFAEVFGIASP